MLAKLPERKTNQWYSGELVAVLIKANDPVIPVKQEKFSLSDPKSVRANTTKCAYQISTSLVASHIYELKLTGS